MLELRVLRRRQEIPRGLEGVMNEELQNSCFPPKIFRAIKARGMRWIANVKETRNAYRILIGNPNGNVTRVWHL
jgi:hypothetical protein